MEYGIRALTREGLHEPGASLRGRSSRRASLVCADAAGHEVAALDRMLAGSGEGFERGEIVRVGPNPPRTICDAIQTPSTAPVNFAVLKERCEQGVAVNDDEVRAAQRFAFARLRLVVEPGGAAALAAALAGKVSLDESTVITLTGGNTDAETFAATLLGQR